MLTTEIKTNQSVLEMHNLLTGSLQEIHSYFPLPDYPKKSGFHVVIDEGLWNDECF